MMILRILQHDIEGMLGRQPAVGIIGPRQAGKTTLALEIARTRPSVYLDLESPTDRAKLSEPGLYLQRHEDALVILDEIQREPGLFQVLRGAIDRGRRGGKRTGRFLVLGSASIDLLRQSSESLAGRISYAELGGFLVSEVGKAAARRDRLWLRGGFPESFLACDEPTSSAWREDFIRTYLERDVPQLGPRIPATTLRRLWTMLAHSQGSTLNAAALAAGLGVSGQTVARYLDLLADLLLVRRLPPWHGNTRKRLVKSPKIFVRDSGIVHRLLGIESFEALLGHPVVGGSWEGFVIENLIAAAPRHAESFFYRTSAGAEIDLLMRFPDDAVWAIEVKRSMTPKPERGFHSACEELEPHARFVVYPGSERFPLGRDVEAIGLPDLVRILRKVAPQPPALSDPP